MVSSFDTCGNAQWIYWLDNERALIGLVDGKILSLTLVIAQFAQYFTCIVPPRKFKSSASDY
jgi:hypothetical protein